MKRPPKVLRQRVVVSQVSVHSLLEIAVINVDEVESEIPPLQLAKRGVNSGAEGR